MKAIPKIDYQRCFADWKKRWLKCIAANGDYFEGDNLNLNYSFYEDVLNPFSTWREGEAAQVRDCPLGRSTVSYRAILADLYMVDINPEENIHTDKAPQLAVHVVQAMIIMQFDFALTNARAPFDLPEHEDPGIGDGYTVVQNKQRRRDTGTSGVTAAHSNSARTTTRRQQSSHSLKAYRCAFWGTLVADYCSRLGIKGGLEIRLGIKEGLEIRIGIKEGLEIRLGIKEVLEIQQGIKEVLEIQLGIKEVLDIRLGIKEGLEIKEVIENRLRIKEGLEIQLGIKE
ncbi:hypothetical protein LAZ67_12002987, partial [Cordylochernes scorpioides]